MVVEPGSYVEHLAADDQPRIVRRGMLGDFNGAVGGEAVHFYSHVLVTTRALSESDVVCGF